MPDYSEYTYKGHIFEVWRDSKCALRMKLKQADPEATYKHESATIEGRFRTPPDSPEGTPVYDVTLEKAGESEKHSIYCNAVPLNQVADWLLCEVEPVENAASCVAIDT